MKNSLIANEWIFPRRAWKFSGNGFFHPEGRLHSLRSGFLDKKSGSDRSRLVQMGLLHCSCFLHVLAHNHPSADPVPSDADIKVTRDLICAEQLLKIPGSRPHHHRKAQPSEPARAWLLGRDLDNAELIVGFLEKPREPTLFCFATRHYPRSLCCGFRGQAVESLFNQLGLR